MGWCDDPKSNKYNKLIYYPFKFNSEKLYRRDSSYDIVISLNFNTNPVKKNKGSAIFLHVSKKNFSPTEGCVAIRKSQLIKIVKTLKKNSKIIIN